MTLAPGVGSGFGVVVLAAYRPDRELFRRQLQSIRDQTNVDLRCVVGSDGDGGRTRAMVRAIVDDDPRFEVIEWPDNVGFYLNFERLLAAVPRAASWVALSDQDDIWHSDKLERLLPHLAEFALVSGQARIVSWPSGNVVLDRTGRRVVGFDDLLLENQITGSMAVFRRELLDLALPFPRYPVVTQLHDHWLGLCAAASGGYTVLDDVVQDYTQHGGNAVGERRRGPGTIRAGWSELLSATDHARGGHGVRAVLQTSAELSFGWRRAMVNTLRARARPRVVAPPLPVLDTRRSAARLMSQAVRSSNVTARTVATFAAGLPSALALSPARLKPRTEGSVR